MSTSNKGTAGQRTEPQTSPDRTPREPRQDRARTSAEHDSDRPPKPAQGISNRETPEQEADERDAFPPKHVIQPRQQDVSRPSDERPVDDGHTEQTSRKAGSRSIAQKESESKYADRGHPASHKVDGAFGREPARTPADAADDSEDASGR